MTRPGRRDLIYGGCSVVFRVGTKTPIAANGRGFPFPPSAKSRARPRIPRLAAAVHPRNDDRERDARRDHRRGYLSDPDPPGALDHQSDASPGAELPERGRGLPLGIRPCAFRIGGRCFSLGSLRRGIQSGARCGCRSLHPRFLDVSPVDHVERIGAVDALVLFPVAGVGAGQAAQHHQPRHEAWIGVRFAGADKLVYLIGHGERVPRRGSPSPVRPGRRGHHRWEPTRRVHAACFILPCPSDKTGTLPASIPDPASPGPAPPEAS